MSPLERMTLTLICVSVMDGGLSIPVMEIRFKNHSLMASTSPPGERSRWTLRLVPIRPG